MTRLETMLALIPPPRISLLDAFEKRLGRASSRPFLPTNPPAVLCHHTSMKGFRGILGQQAFRATDHHDVDDQGELGAAEERIDAVLADLVECLIRRAGRPGGVLRVLFGAPTAWLSSCEAFAPRRGRGGREAPGNARGLESGPYGSRPCAAGQRRPSRSIGGLLVAEPAPRPLTARAGWWSVSLRRRSAPMIDFVIRHLETVIQFAVTVWLASIARGFQVTMAVYGTRLETHREAVRRSRVMWWLDGKVADNWTGIMNEMLDWFAINEVFLTPQAATAFKTIQTWKGLVTTTDGRAGTEMFREAERAMDILRKELLRFRKRTFEDLLGDGWRRTWSKRPKM